MIIQRERITSLVILPVVVRTLAYDFDRALLASNFVLQLPFLGTDENMFWTRRLHDLATDCGCSLGARFAAGYLAVLPVLVAAAALLWHLRMSIVVPFAAVTVFIVAGLGKAVGVTMARVRLNQAIDELRGRHA